MPLGALDANVQRAHRARPLPLLFCYLPILKSISDLQRNWTEQGFEPETCCLTYQALLLTELSSPILAVPQIVNYLLHGMGCQSQAINQEMKCSWGSSPLEYDAINETL